MSKTIKTDYELRMDLMEILEWAEKKGKHLKPFDFSVRIVDFIQKVKQQERERIIKEFKEEMPKYFGDNVCNIIKSEILDKLTNKQNQ